jgi:hypothetical protein
MKVAGSILDEIFVFFTPDLPNPSSLITAFGVDSASNRNAYQEFSLRMKRLQARKADLKAFCEPIV